MHISHVTRAWVVVISAALIELTPHAAATRVLDIAVANRSNAFASIATHGRMVAVTSGQLIIAWDEQSPGSRTIAVARGTIDRNGPVQFSREAIADERPGSYPIVGATESGVVVGWTSGEAPRSVIRTTRFANRNGAR